MEQSNMYPIRSIDIIKDHLFEVSYGIDNPSIWKTNIKQAIFEFLELNNIPKWPLSSAIEIFIDNIGFENLWLPDRYKEYLSYHLIKLQQAFEENIKVMESLLEFFYFFNGIIDKFEIYNYQIEVLNQEIKVFIGKTKEKHQFLKLSFEEISSTHNDIRHDDVFLINFYSFCLEKNSILILDEYYSIQNILTKKPLKFLVSWFSNFKDFENLKVEKKAFLKANLLSFINDTIDLNFMKKILTKDLKPLSDIDINFFKKIINTRVCRQAFQIFIENTLKLGNAPYKTVEEGLNIINYAINHVAGNSTNFYAFLPPLKHAFSSYEFIFISEVYDYEMDCEMPDAIKFLCLLHEISHIYKRIYPGQNLSNKSPSSQIWIKGKLQEGSEDGYRFEKILLPQPFTILYKISAKYLIRENSWNQDLENFKIRLEEISNQACIRGDTPFTFLRGHGHPLGDYCYNPMKALGRNS